MPSQIYPKQIVLKALQWLDNQPDNWAEHIKDSNIAVKMYLKSKGQNKEKLSSFNKEMKEFLKAESEDNSFIKKQNLKDEQELGAFLAHNPTELSSHKPPYSKNGGEVLALKNKKGFEVESLSKNKLSLKEQSTLVGPEPLKSEKFSVGFSLDKKSLQSLKKTQEQLNLHSGEETLRLLIQLGQNSLKKLFSGS